MRDIQISVASSGSSSSSINMASDRQRRPQTSTWPLAETWALDSNIDLSCSRTSAASQTTVVVRGDPIQKVNFSSLGASGTAQSQGDPVARQPVPGAESVSAYAAGCCTPPCQPSRAVTCSTVNLSPPSHLFCTHHVSSSASPHSTRLLRSPVFPASPPHIHSS